MFHNCMYTHGDPLPNHQILNPPIFLQWQFRTQPPNLIPVNIFGYTVCTNMLTTVPSIRTIGTLGQKWDISMYQYTCMFTTVRPVRSYHWDTWTEIGCTYVPIYNMHVTTVPSIRTIGTLEYIHMYRCTCMLPLGVPSIRTNGTLAQDKPMY